jgi:transcriptional activator of cad operon
VALRELDRGFVIADVTVRPAMLEIEREGRCERVEPRIMEVLLYLAQHAPAPITRDELMQEVWAGRVVTEDSLNRVISRLRAIFGDDSRKPRVIDTIPKRGYRLLLEPVPLPVAHDANAATRAPTPSPRATETIDTADDLAPVSSPLEHASLPSTTAMAAVAAFAQPLRHVHFFALARSRDGAPARARAGSRRDLVVVA